MNEIYQMKRNTADCDGVLTEPGKIKVARSQLTCKHYRGGIVAMCANAGVFAELTQKDTFSEDTLRMIEAIGFEVILIEYSWAHLMRVRPDLDRPFFKTEKQSDSEIEKTAERLIKECTHIKKLLKEK